MKIAVCVKEVPDATAPKRLDPGTKRLDRSGEKTMNPYDAHALEEAVRLKEGAAGADSLITALCMGPEGALRTLHKALSLGADEALLVSDPALEERTSRSPRACSPPQPGTLRPTSSCSASRPPTPTRTSWPRPSQSISSSPS